MRYEREREREREREKDGECKLGVRACCLENIRGKQMHYHIQQEMRIAALRDASISQY